MKGVVIISVVCAVCVCCGVTHRRVIKALLKHESMPPAPKWHFRCKNRRS